MRRSATDERPFALSCHAVFLGSAYLLGGWLLLPPAAVWLTALWAIGNDRLDLSGGVDNIHPAVCSLLLSAPVLATFAVLGAFKHLAAAALMLTLGQLLFWRRWRERRRNAAALAALFAAAAFFLPLYQARAVLRANPKLAAPPDEWLRIVSFGLNGMDQAASELLGWRVKYPEPERGAR